MKPDSGALRFAIDCSVDNLQMMSEKVKHLLYLKPFVYYNIIIVL